LPGGVRVSHCVLAPQPGGVGLATMLHAFRPKQSPVSTSLPPLAKPPKHETRTEQAPTDDHREEQAAMVAEYDDRRHK